MYIGRLEEALSHSICASYLKAPDIPHERLQQRRERDQSVGRDTIDPYVLDWRAPRVSGLEVLKYIRTARTPKEKLYF